MTVEIVVSVILVTGVLVTFLQSDLAFVFGMHQCRFLVTEQTEAELYARYPQHIEKYEAAVTGNYIEKVRVDNDDALKAFVNFKANRCLSTAECEALSATVQEGASIMVEDTTVIKLIQSMAANVKFFSTKQILADLGLNSNDLHEKKLTKYTEIASA